MNSIVENPKVTGQVTFQHLDAQGNVISEQTVKNLVVTAGLNHIAARMANSGTPDQMSHMALGSSSTAPALSDTTLGAQLGNRASLAVAGGTPSGNQVTYTATFSAGVATGAVVEAGIFNASTGGTLLCRTTFPVINKADTDSLAVTWIVTVS